MTTVNSSPAPRPIHVAHVLFGFAIGGLENGIVNLINRLDPACYRHAVICLTDYDPQFVARLRTSNFTLHALGKRDGNDPRVWWRMFQLLRRLRPDILHTRNFAALEMHVLTLATSVRGRVHGEHGWDVQDLDGSNRKYQIARRLIGHGVQRFVALSRHIESYLADTVGIPRTKILQICNGVDDQLFRPRPDRQSPAVPLVIGAVGRMKSVKNQSFLCRAFVGLLQRRPLLRGQLCLRLFGEGPLREECLAIARAGDCEEWVECPGDTEQVAAEMRTMDIFVLPSRAEGISNTILEAMASGLPVIATAVGGNPELVEPDSSGVLVPVDDEAALIQALERYIDDSALRRAHGRRGRELVESRYSLNRMVAAYDRLYREIAAGSSRIGAAAEYPADSGFELGR